MTLNDLTPAEGVALTRVASALLEEALALPLACPLVPILVDCAQATRGRRMSVTERSLLAEVGVAAASIITEGIPSMRRLVRAIYREVACLPPGSQLAPRLERIADSFQRVTFEIGRLSEADDEFLWQAFGHLPPDPNEAG